MSLFSSLYPLAQKNALTILIVAEGDQLRVNVMPKSTDDAPGKTLYPLSLLASPEELDRDFAEAVSIYAPGSQSVLEQARAASDANGDSGSAPALPAPTKNKRGPKPGRKSGADPVATDAAAQAAADGAAGTQSEEPPPVDPRQTSIPGLDADSAAAPSGGETATAPAPGPASDADGVDLL